MIMINSRTTLSRSAQVYASKGWPVFIDSYADDLTCAVCVIAHQSVMDKELCSCLLCHGLYSATTNPERIKEMVRMVPKGIVCVRTGEVSGLVAIEITSPVGTRTAVPLEDAGLLPNTLTILENGGGGYLLYQHPGKIRIESGLNRIGPGIHVHADDSYIPMPPAKSRKTGDRLRWLGDSPDGEIAPLHPRILAALIEPVRV